MEQKWCRVEADGEMREYPAGTSYRVIAADFQKYHDNDIVLVFADGKLQELHKTLEKDSALAFETTGDDIGHKTYKREYVPHAGKGGLRCSGPHRHPQSPDPLFPGRRVLLHGGRGFPGGTRRSWPRWRSGCAPWWRRICPICKRTIHTDDAVALFRKHGMHDKERLFEYRRVSKVNIYSMNEFEDYYYGYMVPSARYLRYFALYPYDDGFVIQMPDQSAPRALAPFRPQSKLFHVMKESTAWGDMQGIETVGALNDRITKSGDMRDVVLVQEALQEKKIAQIAERIAGQKETKFVLIAGPSSSGKTTFSHRLSIQLRAAGMVPHPISVDNFFVEREDTPKDEHGNYNFECLEAVDTALFNDPDEPAPGGGGGRPAHL